MCALLVYPVCHGEFLQNQQGIRRKQVRTALHNINNVETDIAGNHFAELSGLQAKRGRFKIRIQQITLRKPAQIAARRQ